MVGRVSRRGAKARRETRGILAFLQSGFSAPLRLGARPIGLADFVGQVRVWLTYRVGCVQRRPCGRRLLSAMQMVRVRGSRFFGYRRLADPLVPGATGCAGGG